MGKLQNVKSIKQFLDGTHRFQTRKSFTFYDAEDVAEKNKTRTLGEVWYDIDPATNSRYRYEQHAGYISKVPANFVGVNASQPTFFNCPKDECTCNSPTRLDHKFRKKTGMCSECVIDIETRKKIDGSFTEYANKKMYDNAVAFFAEMDIQLEELKRSLTATGISFTNENGTVEQWEVENPELVLSTIEANYTEFKNDWLNLLHSKTCQVESE